MPSMTLYRARHIFPVSAPPISDGAVAVGGERIAEVGAVPALLERYAGAPVVDFGETALFPAAVNAHTHLELTGLADAIPFGLPFVEWIGALVRARRALSPRQMERAARDGVALLRASGTAAVGEICSRGQSVVPLVESGLRGVIYYEVLDPNPANARTVFEQARDQITRWRREYGEERIRFGLSPHTPYTVAAELLRLCADYCRDEGVPLSIHAAESPAETQFLLDATGPVAERIYAGAGWPLDPARAPGVSPIAYLDALGMLRGRPLLAHGVQVDADDVARITRAGACVAHCPNSNTRLLCGRFPYALYGRAGAHVALGTDSLASAPSLSVWRELAYAASLHAGAGELPSPEALLQMATLEGATALGLGRELGSLEPGKIAEMACATLETLPGDERGNPASVLDALAAGRLDVTALPRQ